MDNSPISGMKQSNQISRNWCILDYYFGILQIDWVPQSGKSEVYGVLKKVALCTNGSFYPNFGYETMQLCILKKKQTIIWKFWTMTGFRDLTKIRY